MYLRKELIVESRFLENLQTEMIDTTNTLISTNGKVPFLKFKNFANNVSFSIRNISSLVYKLNHATCPPGDFSSDPKGVVSKNFRTPILHRFPRSSYPNNNFVVAIFSHPQFDCDF